MTKNYLLTALCVLTSCLQVCAANYYINSRTGRDDAEGTSRHRPFKSMAALAGIRLQEGDSVLFASGQQFSGSLSIREVRGTLLHPIVVGAYEYLGSKLRPLLDAGPFLSAIHLQNVSFIELTGLEITAVIPYADTTSMSEPRMRCGILSEVTSDSLYESIVIRNVLVHDVFLMPGGYVRAQAEVKTANGTQGYGWGIRFINQTKRGQLRKVRVEHSVIHHVSHTGLKFTASRDGIQQVEVAHCRVHDTGGPGIQLSGVRDGHVHHTTVLHSGSDRDSRNWGRGSGLWTWSCSSILIEHNRFEYANGPGDSAGVHIDFNCRDVIVQFNVSANNAGGFCEILGNTYNCAYRYNISINDGFRIKGEKGAFQEGKIFWLSGYQGNNRPISGPFNSYFYNNTIYVSADIVPRISMSPSTDGVLMANNLFYFERPAVMVVGDQKRNELGGGYLPNTLCSNNLYLTTDSWPSDSPVKDRMPFFGNPQFFRQGGVEIADYRCRQISMVADRGCKILPLPQDSIGLRIGMDPGMDILGHAIVGLPDIGAIEHVLPVAALK